jgi:hypothetical protein
MKLILIALTLSLYSAFASAENYPRPNELRCAESVCSRLSAFGCDTNIEREIVLDSCRNNWGDSCVNFTCKKVSSFECRDFNALTAFSRSCSGVFGESCSAFVCNKLSTFDCNEGNEMINVNSTCQYVSPRELSCVKKSCERGGSFACDSLVEIQKIAVSCREL